MAVEAYVFVECEHGTSRRVSEELCKVAGVKDVKMVTGPYDIIALVEASNFKVLGDVVVSKIQSVECVKRTLTNVVME